MNIRTVNYRIGTTVHYAFNIFTDCIKFHTKASGYEKYKGMETDSNMNSIIGTDRAKMQGYGNYEFKADTNLFSFIDYCYSKEPSMVMACAYRAGSTEANTWDYTKLMSYRDSVVNTAFFRYFWQNMSTYCSSFKDYQDDFFFLHYTYPATQKVGINLAMMRNLQNEGESVKEYLTCLTSYIFSITPQAQVNGMTFGKGDVVPFLYYKDKKHANIDVRYDSDALMDIAKYAYVALIEGWCSLPTPYHLWENEYNWLFGSYDPDSLDYDLETLHQWYDETNQRYCKDKGRKGNNLLGSDIDHIIESDYSIGQQLEATEYYLRQVFNELGIDANFKETMARNELMAKYMMQHSNFDETIKDYNVTIKFMTENLQRGTHEPQNTHTVVTSDFQTLEFPYTMDKRNVNHSDEDGISDGQELGNEKWINITAFVKRTYEDAVRNGKPHKGTFVAQVEDIIEKNGAYIDSGGNKVYGSVKWNDDKTKVLYRVYDYKSNPKLNDTDFDGLWDNNEKNEYKFSNKFIGGTMTENGNMTIDYHNDFRWFLTNPNKYNDELSVMSLIMSNLANAKTISINQLNLSNNIESFLGYLGFDGINNKGIIKLDEATTLNANVYIGYKEIKYYDVKKTVYGVFIGNLDNNRAYKKLVVNNNDEEIINYYNNIASDIIDYINNNLYLTSNNVCYWVTGKGVAGSISSIVSKKLLDSGNETFCYTFGAPQNSIEGNGSYNSIFNIINEDDLIHKMLKSNSKFIQYGKKYNGSIYLDFMREYIDLFGNDYQGDYKITNSISNEYIDIRQNLDNEWFCDRLSNYLVDGRKMLQEDLANTQMFGSHLDTNQKVIFDAKNTKAYYVLSKNLNGFDNNRDNYNDYCEEPNSENTQIVAKDLVVGNGSYERPYYSDTQNLAFNTNEEEFWCKFYINGATDIKYSISSNYKCTLFTKYDGITLNQRRIWFNEGNDIVYKNTEIYNGENEYLVKIERIPNLIEMGNIYIEFVQYQDVIQNVKGAKWIAEDDSVKSTEFEFYDTLYFVNKEIAPLVVKDEYTNNESLIHKREQLINNILTINDYIGAIITINSIRIGAMPQTGEEVVEFLAKNESQSWLKDIIKNRYCTDGYRQSLLDESGYYIPTTITEDANKVIGLCKYGLIIKEQKSNLFESIVTMLKLKECERWDEINAYGLIGTVGRWIDE